MATAAPVRNFCATVETEPIEVACRVRVTAESAQRAVAGWLIWCVGMVICANPPRLQVIGDMLLWEVPLTVNLPTCSPSAPFHSVRVDALSGALLLSPDEADIIRTKSSPIIARLDPLWEQQWQEIKRRRKAREQQP